jgi:hypothetical protein
MAVAASRADNPCRDHGARCAPVSRRRRPPKHFCKRWTAWLNLLAMTILIGRIQALVVRQRSTLMLMELSLSTTPARYASSSLVIAK